MFTPELCPWTRYSLAEFLVRLAGTAGADGMAPPTNTRISARLKCVQEHGSPVNVNVNVYGLRLIPRPGPRASPGPLRL